MAEQGGKLCSKHGHYGVRDTGKGFYEVWYECGHRELDECVSDHETQFDAMTRAMSYANADAVFAKNRKIIERHDNINRFMNNVNVYDNVVGRF